MTTPRNRNRHLDLIEKLGAKSIVLIGMMGCGKSAIGKVIATRLGLQFQDSDAEIVEAAGMSIPDIFENFGEPEFRRLENRVIERLLKEGPSVIALGGGAFMSKKTRQSISRRAISIWLKADLELLLSRVSRRPGKRPLLAKGDPRKILEDLLALREPVYEHADLHVSSTTGSKIQTRDAVLEALTQYLAADTKNREAG